MKELKDDFDSRMRDLTNELSNETENIIKYNNTCMQNMLNQTLEEAMKHMQH